jgi:serine protease Do
MILKKEVGDKVMLRVVRSGRLYPVGVEIGARPEEEKVVAKKEKRETKSYQEEVNYKNWRGLEVSDIAADMILRFNLSNNSGVIVVNIEPASPAEKAGIRIGDVIYEIDRTSVKNVREYVEAVKKAEGDVLVGTYRGYVVVKER